MFSLAKFYADIIVFYTKLYYPKTFSIPAIKQPWNSGHKIVNF